MAAVAAASFHLVIGISLAFSAIVVPDLTRNITNNETDSGEITADKTECSWIGKNLNYPDIFDVQYFHSKNSF